jgi:cysteine desulfurase
MNKIANYFDYAAATPLLPEAREAMGPYFSSEFYNPSALYLKARQNRLVLESARRVIAQGLGAKPLEIIFTAGGTEANNLAIRGVLANHPKAKVLVSAIEHESVLAPASLYNCQQLPVDARGIVKIDALQKALTDEVVLISVMYANNEIGAIQPIREISQIIKLVNKSRQNRGVKLLLFHSDACQAVNYLDMQVDKLGLI